MLDNGNSSQAVGIFKKVLSLKPGHADAHLGLGESYNDMGKKGEARKHYQKYLELKPDAQDRLEIEAILKNL
jgi:Flp pilus assembly protein TadD